MNLLTMTKASKQDRNTVADLLSLAFATNKSVNYILKTGNHRSKYLKALMLYSFDYCWMFGDIWLTDDKNACVLMVYPDRKKTSLKSIFLDLKLICNAVGVRNITKTLKREKAIKEVHPQNPFCYLWYIAVHPSLQKNGIGTQLLKELVSESAKSGRHIYLETSTQPNVPWYEKNGFEIYKTLDFGFPLYCMKN